MTTPTPLLDYSVAVVTTTVADADTARRLARSAVRERLAACVQVDTIESHYVWCGAEHAEAEWRLTCKTLPGTVAALLAWLRAQHPYEVPQLLCREERAEADYASWVARQVDA